MNGFEWQQLLKNKKFTEIIFVIMSDIIMCDKIRQNLNIKKEVMKIATRVMNRRFNKQITTKPENFIFTV